MFGPRRVEDVPPTLEQIPRIRNKKRHTRAIKALRNFNLEICREPYLRLKVCEPGLLITSIIK